MGVAIDLEQGARRSISELSSGTRMQLLLAARLSWTRSIERGRSTLPIFVDEALTTADADRFARVAESLMPASGRLDAAEVRRVVLWLEAARAGEADEATSACETGHDPTSSALSWLGPRS